MFLIMIDLCGVVAQSQRVIIRHIFGSKNLEKSLDLWFLLICIVHVICKCTLVKSDFEKKRRESTRKQRQK